MNLRSKPSSNGYSVADVAQRLDTTTHSLHTRLKKFGEPNHQASDKIDLSAENALLKHQY
jgi:transposase